MVAFICLDIGERGYVFTTLTEIVKYINTYTILFDFRFNN